MPVGISSSPLLIRSSALIKYKEMNALKMEKVTQLSIVEAWQSALAHIHKEVSFRNERRHSKDQALHSMGTKFLSHNSENGDYAMIRSHAKLPHKLQTKWIALMMTMASG